MLAVSGAMFSGISATVFLFIKSHNTPVVNSSNKILTAIQLSSQFLLVIILPFIYIGIPNVGICFIRLVVIGVLLTISSAVSFCKINTLLHIFNSHMTHSKKKRLKTKANEIFAIALLVLVSISISVVCFQNSFASVIYIVSDKEKYRDTSCNRDNHVLFQLAWIFLLTVVNSMQAVRSRHLPECFKETRILMLANILSSVICGNAIWLSFFQGRKVDQLIFLFYGILSLNSINFCILYVYKVIILLLAPEKNTKHYFNLVIRKKVAQQQAITLEPVISAVEEQSTQL